MIEHMAAVFHPKPNWTSLGRVSLQRTNPYL